MFYLILWFAVWAELLLLGIDFRFFEGGLRVGLLFLSVQLGLSGGCFRVDLRLIKSSVDLGLFFGVLGCGVHRRFSLIDRVLSGFLLVVGGRFLFVATDEAG